MAVGFDDPNLDIDPTSAWWTDGQTEYSVGYLYEWHGNHYWYVGVVDGALTAGDVVTWATTSGYVTPADTSSAGLFPAGVAVHACPVGGFCFIQCSGVGTQDLTTDGNVAATNALQPAGTPDGTAIPNAAGSEESHFALAFAADATTTLAAGKWIFKGCI